MGHGKKSSSRASERVVLSRDKKSGVLASIAVSPTDEKREREREKKKERKKRTKRKKERNKEREKERKTNISPPSKTIILQIYKKYWGRGGVGGKTNSLTREPEMKIQLGKYLLRSDKGAGAECFTLTEIVIGGERSKNPGKEKLGRVRYYADFEQVLMGLARQALLDSEAESLAQLREEISKLRQVVDYHYSIGR